MRLEEAAGGNSYIVGFYRGHTRPDFAITEEDASLFSTYFRDPSDVFLLIKPDEGGPPTGGFIIREGGKVLSDSPYAQFRLEGMIAIPAARETPVRAAAGTPGTGSGDSDRSTSGAARKPPGRRGGRSGRSPLAPWSWPWVSTLLFIGAFPMRYPANPGRSLGLNVTSVENSLRLSWDHQLPPS